MKRQEVIVVGMKNLLLLVFVSLPICLTLIYTQLRWRGDLAPMEPRELAETAAFYYVSWILPFVVGGLIHQLAWVHLPSGWSPARRRIAGAALSPVIPLALLMFYRAPVASMVDFALPLTVSLALYVLLTRSPRSFQIDQDSSQGLKPDNRGTRGLR